MLDSIVVSLDINSKSMITFWFHSGHPFPVIVLNLFLGEIFFFTVTHNHDPMSLLLWLSCISHVVQLLKHQPHYALSWGLPAFWETTLHRALNNLVTVLICRYYLGLYNFAKVILLSGVMIASTCLALLSSTAAAWLPLQSLLLKSVLSFSLGLPLIL